MACCIVLPSIVGIGRLPGWDERLRQLLRERSVAPFCWGSNDCCMFAADAVEAMIGVDPAESLRGAYGSEAGAAQVLEDCGGLEGIARRVLGEPLRAPMLACRGDVGIVSDGRQQLLAVCSGAGWNMPMRRGLGLLPLPAARLAWRVGCG